MTLVTNELFRALSDCVLDPVTALTGLKTMMGKLPRYDNYEIDFDKVLEPEAIKKMIAPGTRVTYKDKKKRKKVEVEHSTPENSIPGSPKEEEEEVEEDIEEKRARLE